MGSGRAYEGKLGQTTADRVRYTCRCGAVHTVNVYRSIDVNANPELSERMLSADAASVLNGFRCERTQEHYGVSLPVVYHAPDSDLFLLVLPESMRHRELQERIALLQTLADDQPGPLPRYVREFGVVFGRDELEAYLEAEAERALARVRNAEADQQLRRRRLALEERERTIGAQQAEIERLVEALDRGNADLDERLASVEAREAAIDRRSKELDQQSRRLATPPVADEPTPVREAPRPAQRPATNDDGATKVGAVADVAIERWIVSGEPTLIGEREDGQVRFAASISGPELDELVSKPLEVRLELHRMPTYPVVCIEVGSTESLAGEGPRPISFLLELEEVAHRGVLHALQSNFTFTLELFDKEYLPVKQKVLSANLSDNVPYVMAAAEAHIKNTDEHDCSFTKAVIALNNPSYDRYGLHHPERRQFSEEALSMLDTPNQVRRALAVAERFSIPDNEEYLLMIRSYPLALWHARRREIVERAVELGLWPGGDLAQVAVSEGIARSRKDLIKKLQSNFTMLSHDPADLENTAIEDNWAALEHEGERLGLVVERARREPVIRSEGADQVSGTIGTARVRRNAEAGERHQISERGMDELIGLLENKDRRKDAAIELASREEERAIGPVFNTLRRMTRGEAVQVLGAAVGFGARASAHLIDGLRSRKAFLRQGCALALAVLGGEEAIEAICDLLISEPTPIWKEVARGIGEVGPSAVMSLASRLRGNAESSERIAWALAHVSNNDGRPQVETLAGSRDQRVAAAARRALEIAPDARVDNAVIHGDEPPREQTVNRAFSRRFFAALDNGDNIRAAVHQHEGADISAPAMVLDEADLLEASDLDEVEPLDENDLLPT